MRTLESLRGSCVDGTILQTAWNDNIALPLPDIAGSQLMQKVIPTSGFYYFYVNLTYAIENGNWVDGTDFLKADIYTSDTSEHPATVYNPIINTRYEQHGNVFTATLVLYCNAGHTYGLSIRASKVGTAEVHLFETMRIF
jgi:hypothetical protein